MAKQQKSTELDVCIPVAQKKTLFQRVAAYLDTNDWNYTAFEEKHYFTTGTRLKDGSVRTILDVSEQEAWDRVLVYSTYPTYVPEHRRAAMLQAINRINYTLAFGSFDLDMKDGEIRLRTVVEGTGDLSDAMIDRVHTSNLRTTDRYQAALLAVAFGNASPDAILELAERSEEAKLQ